jgi:hypothetical protein
MSDWAGRRANRPLAPVAHKPVMAEDEFFTRGGLAVSGLPGGAVSP